MLKNISRKAKSLLHDGPLSNEVEMKYVSENRQRMMEIVQGQNHKITRASRTCTNSYRHSFRLPVDFKGGQMRSDSCKTIDQTYYVISRIKYRTDS